MRYFVLLLFVFSFFSLKAQDCPPGDVIISSQADMDDFVATYPNCTVIDGDFEIVSLDEDIGVYVNITVASLPALERIEGELSFSTHTDMTNGFTNLTYVGGSLGSQIDLDGIFPALDTIGGDVYNYGYIGIEPSRLTASFPALKYVGGGFVTQGSEGGYIDSDGFPVLERIEGGLYDCTEHSAGITLSGFPALKYIGGDVEVESGTISGMNMLDTIVGSITLRDCYFNMIYINITGLNELDYVGGGGFNFISDNCVSDLSGLCNYFSNGGSFSISTSLPSYDCSISEADVIAVCNGCPTDFIFTTQQEIDEFSTTYPSCTTINGDLTISEASPGSITNLNGLNTLDTIYGGIYIYNNDVLTDISGLTNVVYSEITNLEIYDNAALSTCSLPNLCNYLVAGGTSNIYNNLTGCDSVPAIQANCSQCPPDNVELLSQQDLTDFMASYPNCTTINGDLSIQTNVNDISLLSQITTINGSLVIDDCDLITDLNGLSNITSIEDDLTIFSTDNLSSLAGLENITSIGGDLSIRYNDLLTDLAGLANISSIGRALIIERNDNLSSLESLENITSLGGKLVISNNSQLTSLAGLENITSIGGYLWISGGNMTNLNGLNNLTSIDGDVTIFDNDALVNLTGLDNLTSMNGDLKIEGNDNLASLTGLGNIDHSGIDVIFLQYNSNLSTCEVFTFCNYIDVGGTAYIFSNAIGCNSVAQIEAACDAVLPIEMTDPLRVHLNNETAVITWRAATETNNAGFEIQKSKDGIEWERIGWQNGQGNSSTLHRYTYRDKNPFFGTSYYRLKQVDFNGDFSYSNVASLRYTPQVSFYPNPVKDKLYIHTNEQAIDNVLIFDTSGRQFAAQVNNNSIDVSTFSSGIYTIKLTVKGEDFYEKIIVE